MHQPQDDAHWVDAVIRSKHRRCTHESPLNSRSCDPLRALLTSMVGCHCKDADSVSWPHDQVEADATIIMLVKNNDLQPGGTMKDLLLMQRCTASEADHVQMCNNAGGIAHLDRCPAASRQSPGRCRSQGSSPLMSLSRPLPTRCPEVTACAISATPVSTHPNCQLRAELLTG